ncbi:THUMP domain-containing protein [Klebsiella pneumoniae]|nr:THUMP domain-containing protein [Klebsiella pneumoniae]
MSPVEDVLFTSLHDTTEQTLPLWREALEGKTFCVRAKRRGKHEFTSALKRTSYGWRRSESAY